MMKILVCMVTFVAVVKAESFTAAAKTLRLSKSVVSKHVTQLENHLNARLLHRTTRCLSLTEAGKVFYQYCEQIVSDAQAAELAVRELQQVPSGTLRISAPQSLAISCLREVLPAFQSYYPKLHLDIKISGQLIDLVKENIDVSLRVGELTDSSMTARRLVSCTMMVCATPHYWDHWGRPVHPSELVQHNCLIYTELATPYRWEFFDPIEKREITVAVTGNLQTNDGNILLNATLAGQGIMIAPSFLFHSYLERGQLEAILSTYYKPSLGVYAIYPNTHKHLSAKVRVFIDFLAKKWQAVETPF